ncbi:ATP-binding protein [Streptomyces bobili]|uniref:ATP-binding protein n=1 Tax=Streptomyces bobili TaxID=67280 RepID=UPI003415C738
MSTTRASDRSSVPVAAPSAIRVLPAVPATVPVLRAFARQTVTRWGGDDRAREDLALIVTELVTNACRHSGSPYVSGYLFRDGHTVGVRVSDMGSWRQPERGNADDDLHGRGLLLVEAHAETVRIRRTSTGTQVTATVAVGA